MARFFIEYDGVRWYQGKRDPYFRNSRRGLLHRWMYVREVGPIPAGMQVHHRNHDKLDNRPENFVLLSPGEHWAEHGDERGQDWHSQGGHATWAKAEYHQYTCEHCGTEFESRGTFGARFCSNRCRDYASRPREERVCGVCGDTFTCQTRYPTTTCSRKCTAARVAQIKRERKGL